jgi:hypothetical protein
MLRNPLLALLVGVSMFCSCLAAYLAGKRGPFVIAAALLAFFYAHLWLVWTGEAEEVTRHALLVNLQLHLGIWLSGLWLLDAVLLHSATVTDAPESQAPASSTKT